MSHLLLQEYTAQLLRRVPVWVHHVKQHSRKCSISLQPFSQKSRTPTVAKEFQIGLYDPTEADLKHFWNCCSEGFSGERLYVSRVRYPWKPPRLVFFLSLSWLAAVL